MHILYWNRNSSSLAPMAVLEETGIPYRAVPVDMAEKAHKAPEHLARHPLGLVPALTLPGGGALIESAAITGYCASLVPGAGLSPAPGNIRYGRYLQWLSFGAATIYTAYMRLYQTYDYTVTAGDGPLIQARAREHLVERWQLVEDALAAAGERYLLGPQPSAADIYLAMLAGWHFDLPEFSRTHPRIRSMRDGVNQMAGMRRAVAVHFPGEIPATE